MKEQPSVTVSPGDSSSQGQPGVGDRVIVRDAPPAPNVLPGLAMGSLVGAILLSLLIAITRGETTPLYITWIAALAMAAVFGIVAAVPRVRSRRRARNPGPGAVGAQNSLQ